MNRYAILLTLLVTFLSCGHSSSEFLADRFRKSLFRPLSKEEQLLSERLDELFTGMNRKGLFNGSVLVSRAGTILYRKALGLADKQNNLPLSDTSMFQLASVSKVITATAVLLLYERELLDIHKPFKDYFPDFPYEKVTIQDLLNHRSGLPNYLYTLNNEICQPNKQMSNQEMYSCFISKNARPYLRPNTRFNYCNTNYALLGLLVEKVSGTSFSAFLREELFKPLGMNHTATITDLDLNAPNVTRPYDNRWRSVAFDASDFVLGDKSIYSTPYDLYLFSEAMYNNRIIHPETQKLAYTAFSKEQRQSNYGLGWRLVNHRDPSKMEVYHNGWWHGYRTAFHRRLSDSLTIVILSNQLNRTAYQTYQVYDILDNTVLADAGTGEDGAEQE